MFVQLLKIRIKQLVRELVGLGILRAAFVLVLMALFGGFINYNASEQNRSIFLAGLIATAIYMLHISRNDIRFLKIHAHRAWAIMWGEYILLASPVYASLAYYGQWPAIAILLSASLLTSFLPEKIKTRNLQLNWLKLVPAPSYEWIAGLRKSYWFMAFVWLTGLALSTYIGSVPVAIFVLGVVVLSFYENYEPLFFIILQEKSAQQLLLLKVKHAILMFSILVVPLFVPYLFFHFQYWYIVFAVFVLFCSLLVYVIFTKYAFYSPNTHSPAARVFAAFGIAGAMLPFFLPAIWGLCVYFYFKSVRKLNVYLYDFR